jgi:UDP-N-acetyl-D-glucosamine dehydrogenase
VEAAAAMLAAHLRPGATVILESTTYPGTTEELVRPILEEGSGLVAGDDFFLGYSPERIDPGNTTWDLISTPKVVSGIDAGSLDAVSAFYGRIVDTCVPVSGTREAELVKLLENTFRHVNVALVNELAMFAGDLGIDIWEAIQAASTKPFGYMRFTPGPGVGGHCLPVDPSYLSWAVRRTLGESFRFVELANDVNAHMPDYVVRRLGFAGPAARAGLQGQHR